MRKITTEQLHIAYTLDRKAPYMARGQNEIEHTLSHLPKLIEVGELLDGQTASQVRAIVESQNGGLSRLLDAQISNVTTSSSEELGIDGEGHVRLTPEQLRGVIARSAIAGSSQTLFTVAESIEQGQRLDILVNGAPESAA